VVRRSMVVVEEASSVRFEAVFVARIWRNVQLSTDVDGWWLDGYVSYSFLDI
jgi:hypothetical protein